MHGELELRHKIAALRIQLQDDIAHEAYEHAAELRDTIRELENQLTTCHKKEENKHGNSKGGTQHHVQERD